MPIANEISIVELRKWSAELMGWEIYHVSGGYSGSPNDSGIWPRARNRPGHPYAYYRLTNTKSDLRYDPPVWDPDNTNSGKIWMVINKMMALGFSYKLGDNNPPGIHYCEFWKTDINRFIEGRAFDYNPCLAILKAAYVAMEEANA